MSLLTQASLIMTPNAVKESKVYSIIPSNGNGDLTFTRGTAATSTLNNDAGLIETVPYNLFNYSQDYTDVAWSKSNSTITANSTQSPNGTNTASRITENSLTVQHFISTNVIISSNTAITASVYVKFDSANRRFFLQISDGTNYAGVVLYQDGSVSALDTGFSNRSFSSTSVGNGWYRLQISLTTSTATNIITRFMLVDNINAQSYTGDGVSGLFVWGAQFVQGSLPKDYFFTTDRLNVPRLNYNTVGGCPALLLEPQRTNLLLNSVWAGGGTTPTSWSLNGTGVSTRIASIKNPNVGAYNFVSTAIARIYFFQTQTFTINTTSCLSVYVESASVPVQVQFILAIINAVGTPTYFKNNVSITATTNIEAGNTYSIVYAASATTTISEVRVGLHNTGIVGNVTLSMPQLETGVSSIAAYSTSFIPTTTGAVTRNADTFTRSNIYTNGLITSAGGTWFVELNNNIAYVRDASSSSVFIDTAVGGVTNGFSIKHVEAGTSRRLVIVKIIGSSSSIFYQTLTDIVKIAIKWNGTTADIFVNGIKVVSATAFTTTAMEFLGGYGSDVPKYIKSTILFPTPLTDTECISLTT